MFGFGKPKALIVVNRQTGAEEFTSVTVNASKASKKAIYDAIIQAGEAMRLRLIENNNLAKVAMDNMEKEDKTFDPTKKKGLKRIK